MLEEHDSRNISYFLCSKFQEHRIPFLCHLRQELQAASVDPQQLEQQASRAAQNWCFRSLPNQHWSVQDTPETMCKAARSARPWLQNMRSNTWASNETSFVENCKVGTTAPLSPLVLQNKCTLFLFFETFHLGGASTTSHGTRSQETGPNRNSNGKVSRDRPGLEEQHLQALRVTSVFRLSSAIETRNSAAIIYVVQCGP